MRRDAGQHRCFFYRRPRALNIISRHAVKPAFRIALTVFMVAAGALHFIATGAYVSIMPAYLPWHLELVYISGVLEVLGGVGLLVPGFRRAAGIGLIALFVAVLPANVNMALHDIQPLEFHIPEILLWLRLPLQLVLIAWAWWVSSENT